MNTNTTKAVDLDAMTIDQAQQLAAENGWTVYPLRGKAGINLQQTFGRGDFGITVFYRDGRVRPSATSHTVNTNGRKLVRDLRAALTA
jgi:hypothetical protein